MNRWLVRDAKNEVVCAPAIARMSMPLGGHEPDRAVSPDFLHDRGLDHLRRRRGRHFGRRCRKGPRADQSKGNQGYTDTLSDHHEIPTFYAVLLQVAVQDRSLSWQA